MADRFKRGSETLATFAYFRKRSPQLSLILIAFMALSVLGMSIFSMVERGQIFLIPIIVVVVIAWSAIYLSSRTREIGLVHNVGPRVLLFVVVGFFLTGFVREEPSITAVLFIFPFILLTFLSVPAREAAMWSILGIASILGASWIGSEGFAFSGVEITDINSYVFILAIVAQLSITYLLNGSARASAAVAEDRQKVLRESNDRYETLFESIDEGLIITDANGIVNFVNNTGLMMLGLTEDEILGDPITGTVFFTDETGKDLSLTQHPFNVVATHQARASLDFVDDEKQMIKRFDNESFRVAYNVSPIFSSEGLTGTIFLFRDITQLSQMDKAKTEFVSLASHQLRTPLSVISWYTEKLVSEKKGELNDNQRRYMQEIESSNTRMSRLVNDLLSVSRAELGKVKVSYEPVDVRRTMQQLYNDVHQSVEKKSITMHVTLEKGNTKLENSDESLVEAIIQNLFTNAIKYSPEHTTISVHLAQSFAGKEMPGGQKSEHSGLLLSVKDSGVGIPKDQQSKIFSKMFRAENVQAMNVDGTGLGLYLSKKFSQVLGGDLWFESEEGEGTAFYLFLPFFVEIKQELSTPNKVKKAFDKRKKEVGELFA